MTIASWDRQLVKVEIADRLAGGGVLGLFHGFFEFFGEDVFLMRLLEEGIREFVLALPLLLLEDARSLRQVYVRPRSYMRFMRKYCAKNGINHQLCLAARTCDVQVFALFRHAPYCTPAGQKTRGTMSRAPVNEDS